VTTPSTFHDMDSATAVSKHMEHACTSDQQITMTTHLSIVFAGLTCWNAKRLTTSSLRTLHPFIDDEGILRVGRRVQQSTLPYHLSHQIILPPRHHFSKLIVSSEHIRLHHAVPQLLMASLREKCWIPRIRDVVKSLIIA
jgi:hypothetical protein